MKSKFIVLLSFIAIFVFVSPASVQAQVISCSGALASVSSCLTPGQWGEVTGMTGYSNVAGSGISIFQSIPHPTFYGGNGTDDSVLSFMDKGKWNPQTHELYIYGGAHNTGCPCEKWFIIFNADTNAWRYGPMPPDATGADWGGGGSGYPVTGKQTAGQHFVDWNALDTVNQDFYVRDTSISAGEARAMQFHIPTQTWTTLPHDFAQNGSQDSTQQGYEYFPDLDSLIYTNASANLVGGVWKGVVSQYMHLLGNWAWLNGAIFGTNPTPGTQGYQLNMGENYGIARYDNQHHVLYFGGGGADSDNPSNITHTNQMYQLQMYNGTTCSPSPASGAATRNTGCTTALPTTGAPSVICMRCGIQDIDPVTGDLVILIADNSTGPGSLVKYNYHYGDSSWTSVNAGPASGHPLLWNPFDSSYPMFNTISTPIPDDGTYQGVDLYVQHLYPGTLHVYVRKNAQRPSFAAKCSAAGVLNCWSFNSPSNIDSHGTALSYNWDANNTTLNNAMIALGQSTNYPVTGWRNPGEGLSKAYNMYAAPGAVNTIAQVDNSTNFDGGGSLLIPMGQYNMEQTAYFYDNLDGNLGHPNVAICKTLANCPQGSTIWAQAMVRFSDAMINDFVYECSLYLSGACQNSDTAQAFQVNDGTNSTADKTFDCKTGSTINCGAGYAVGFCIAASNPGDCPASHVGKQIFISGGTNCVSGAYTITAVTNYYEVVLSSSPSTVGNQCVHANIDATENLARGAQPWKMILMVTNALPVGAAPNGAPNGNCECKGEVMTGRQATSPGFPQFYDTKGNNLPDSPQFNYRFLANTWHEITEEIIVGDSNVANSEVKWWVDGNLAYDWTAAKLLLDGGDDGYGIGQIQLETYQTRQDAFFRHSAAGSTWYDDVITSTSPIAFNNVAGGAQSENDTLSKTAPASVNTSSSMTYTINLGNSGSAVSSTTLTVADQLPTGAIATACNISTNVASVSCGSLPTAPGALMSITVNLTSAMASGATNGTSVFTITATSPSSAGTSINYASVDASGGSSPAVPGAGCGTTSCGSGTTIVNAPAQSHAGRLRVKKPKEFLHE